MPDESYDEHWERNPNDRELLHEIMTYDKASQRSPCKARITVVEQVYYQSTDCNGRDFSVATSFSQEVVSDEQPCRRELKVTQEWLALDRGWIKGCGLIILENPKNGAPKVELALIASREWIPEEELLRQMEPAFILRPGRSLRAQPEELDRLYIRCPTGTCKVNLTLYPE